MESGGGDGGDDVQVSGDGTTWTTDKDGIILALLASEITARTGKTPDCHGALTWSRPTEPFRVAAPFDVLGTANRPITIKMPDLRELAAQAALRPKGRLSPVRFVQPQHLSPKIQDGQPQENDVGGEAICRSCVASSFATSSSMYWALSSA